MQPLRVHMRGRVGYRVPNVLKSPYTGEVPNCNTMICEVRYEFPKYCENVQSQLEANLSLACTVASTRIMKPSSTIEVVQYENVVNLCNTTVRTSVGQAHTQLTRTCLTKNY